LQRKSQFPQSAKLIVALKSSYKGGEYGIPDFNRCCLNDGAVRADHRRLFKAARMVTANHNKEVMEVNTISTPSSMEVVKAENAIAALLSVAPGLGHIYKGHLAAGFIWMFFGMPVAIWIGILLGLATAGVGLLFPIVCWAALAFDAYYERDLRKHHWFLPSSDAADDDEFGD
jgi:hypothetical protein